MCPQEIEQKVHHKYYQLYNYVCYNKYVIVLDWGNKIFICVFKVWVRVRGRGRGRVRKYLKIVRVLSPISWQDRPITHAITCAEDGASLDIISSVSFFGSLILEPVSYTAY